MLLELRKQISLLVLSSLLCALGCSKDRSGGSPEVAGAGTEVASGHDRMLAILQQIKDRGPNEFPFFGHQVQVRTRQELQSLPLNGNPFQRFALLNMLGCQELFYEESPRLAIEHLTESYELFPRLKLADPDGRNFDDWNRNIFYLAVAWLRLGETENCCSRQGGR